MTYDSLLIDICQLGIRTTTTNSLGETKESWTYSSTDTPCRWTPIVASQRIQLPGEFQDVRYTVHFASGASVSGGKRIQHSSKAYLIVDEHMDSSYHHITCLVKELAAT